MSTTNIEDIPTQTPVEHLAELLRREDTSQWEKVDAVKEAVDGEAAGDDAPAAAGASLAGGDPSVNTGLQAAIAKVWEQIEAIVPEPPEIRTVRGWYTVATFWPAETRVAGASFAAHAELAVKAYPHRQGILSKLADRSSKPVSRDDVRVWKQHQNGAELPDPWEVRFGRRVFTPLRSRLTGPKTQHEWEQARAAYQDAIVFIETKLEEF